MPVRPGRASAARWRPLQVTGQLSDSAVSLTRSAGVTFTVTRAVTVTVTTGASAAAAAKACQPLSLRAQPLTRAGRRTDDAAAAAGAVELEAQRRRHWPWAGLSRPSRLPSRPTISTALRRDVAASEREHLQSTQASRGRPPAPSVAGSAWSRSAAACSAVPNSALNQSAV